jgi:membrane associated rhomboid family serine protease
MLCYLQDFPHEMAYSDRSYARPYLGVPSLPPGVKWLIIINVAIFLLGWAIPGLERTLTLYFALIPSFVVKKLFVWTIVTYLFLHGSIWHILFNMLSLWMFGSELETTWGTRGFLRFYFFCGAGAGVCVVVMNYLFSNPNIPTIGASGAIYGILLAWAVLWPDRIILMSFLFPIKVKYFVMIFGAIAFLNSFNANSGVSEFAHLGGMAFGYAYLKMPRRSGSRAGGRGIGYAPSPRFDPIGAMRRSYQAWKLARAKKKFQVYMKKQGRGPFVN